MKYLVTGCAGFIGSHLVERLLADGAEVVGLDNFATGHRHNLNGMLGHFELIEGDIRDLDACRRACQGVDHVLHQAALGSVPRSVADPITTNATNIDGTLNMLVAARDAEVQSFVFAASSSAYGDTPTLPKHEAMPKRPMSPYAVTKSTCEDYLEVFWKLYGLPTVGLRYFNIFGARQDPNGPYAAVIPKFIRALQAGDVPVIHGDGEQTRDFTHVANAVSANLLATQHATRAGGRVVNVACGENISLNRLYEMIADELHIEARREYGPPRPGDVRDSLADISLAAELLDYDPLVDVAEGLRRTVAWFEVHR